RRGDVGAFSRRVEQLFAGGVGHGDGALDEEDAERLAVDRAGPELRAADADRSDRGRDGDLRLRLLRYPAGDEAEGAAHGSLQRALPGDRVVDEAVEDKLRIGAERQRRAVVEGELEARPVTGRDALVGEDGRAGKERRV